MTANAWAPIALFIYKRPAHTRRMIEHLRACPGFDASRVFVFADGPREPSDRAAVEETRAEARRLLGDHAEYRERESNLGIDNSEISAITELCDRFGSVVVVEDDLVVSPAFLEFLNRGLAEYADEPRVMEISGFVFDVPGMRDTDRAVLLPLTSAWGWATWKRAWDLFDPEATDWVSRLSDPRARRRFNAGGHFNYTRMLEREMQKAVPAWDIRWYYTLFSCDGLALHPPRTLVLNEGFDGSGTHNRLALPIRQAFLDQSGAFTMPSEVAASPYTAEVNNAIGGFRQASIARKVRSLVTAIRTNRSG